MLSIRLLNDLTEFSFLFFSRGWWWRCWKDYSGSRMALRHLLQQVGGGGLLLGKLGDSACVSGGMRVGKAGSEWCGEEGLCQPSLPGTFLARSSLSGSFSDRGLSSTISACPKPMVAGGKTARGHHFGPHGLLEARRSWE